MNPLDRSRPMITHTRTYVIMKVSKSTYDEIAAKMKEAGYDHVFQESRENGVLIDMHGLALGTEDTATTAPRSI